MNTNQQEIDENTIDLVEGSARTMFLTKVAAIVKSCPYWSKMSEHEQRQMLNQVSEASTTLVKDMVAAIATDGRQVVEVMVESVTIKDGIKVTLTAPKSGANVHDLGSAAGMQAYLVPYVAAKHLDTDVKLNADPDQPNLIDPDALTVILPAEDRIRITDGGKVNLIVNGVQYHIDDVDALDGGEDDLDALAEAFGLESDADVNEITSAIQKAVGDGSFITFDKRKAEVKSDEEPSDEAKADLEDQKKSARAQG